MENIETLLRGIYSLKAKNLTKTEQKIHDCVLQNPDQIIYSTIRQISVALNSSDASFVRYFNKLGFQTFVEFKMDLLKQTEQIHHLSEGNFYEKIYENTVNTLTETKKNIKKEDIDLATEIITNSNKLVLCGMGVSNLSARDAFSKLLRIGIDTELIDDSHFLFMRASIMKEGDALLCYSFSGETQEVIKAAKIAKKSGAKIVSITNRVFSDLREISDVSLFTSGYDKSIELGFNSQKISQLYITDVLLTSIALKEKDKAVENINKTTRSLIEEI